LFVTREGGDEHAIIRVGLCALDRKYFQPDAT